MSEDRNEYYLHVLHVRIIVSANSYTVMCDVTILVHVYSYLGLWFSDVFKVEFDFSILILALKQKHVYICKLNLPSLV